MRFIPKKFDPAKPLNRRTTRNTVRELRELDYLEKLSHEERQYLKQFMYEYYQADFNFEDPIHPNEYRKDCQDRNNASKRQIHSVGSDILEQAKDNARSQQPKSQYYTPEDYQKGDYFGYLQEVEGGDFTDEKDSLQE